MDETEYEIRTILGGLAQIDSVRVLGDVLSALLADNLDSYNFATKMR